MYLRKRKPVRRQGYDYSQNGMYFLTFCTKSRACILSEIVGGGLPDAPYLRITEYGRIVIDVMESINESYDAIEITQYVVMPNHVHLIVLIHAQPTDEGDRMRSPSNATIPSLVSTIKRMVNKKAGFSLWQRSYHDHIIRDEREHQMIWDYIDQNPVQWQSDIYFSANTKP